MDPGTQQRAQRLPRSARRAESRGARRTEWPLGLFFLPALAVHLSLLALVALWAHFHPPPPKPVAKRQVTMRALSAREWDSNRGPASAATTRPSNTLQRPKPMPKGQVVDVAPGNHQAPTESKYLAETDNTVKKETVARVQVSAPGMKGTQMTTAGAAKPPATHAPVQKSARASPVGLKDRLAMMDAHGMKPRLLDLMHAGPSQPATPEPPAPEPDPAPPTNGDEADGPHGEAPGAVGSGATGAANDDLHDVEKGDGTFLNTREFMFAGFMNRVKQAVSAHWDPNGRMNAQDPRRSRYAGIAHTTVLQVAIDTEGRLRDCYVARSSGLDFLDAEAMQAFSKAQPFPNPPKGMFRGSDVVIFTFTFTIDVGGNGIPQMFRTGR